MNGKAKIEIADHYIDHHWVNPDDPRERCRVEPDWYQSNGTPIARETGCDMEYQRTTVTLQGLRDAFETLSEVQRHYVTRSKVS